MLSLPAVLTQQEAAACLRALESDLLRQGEMVCVDAGSLQRFDSSALAVLLALRRRCQRADKAFSVRRLPRFLLDLAELYGVAVLLEAGQLEHP